MNKLEKYILAFYVIFCVFLIAQTAYAKPPHCDNCECIELRRIRMILESQFNVVCDERRCVGSSSSSNGSEMP